jgi:hypothetical protein
MSKMSEFMQETAGMMGLELAPEFMNEILLACRIRLDAKLAEQMPGVSGLVGFGPPPGQQGGSMVVGRDMETVYDSTQPAFGMGDVVVFDEEDDEKWSDAEDEAKIFTIKTNEGEDVYVTHWRITDTKKMGRMLQVWKIDGDWMDWASHGFINDCLKKIQDLGIPEYDPDPETDSQIIYDDMEKAMKKVKSNVAVIRCPKCGSDEVGSMSMNGKQMICCENPDCDYVGEAVGQVKVTGMTKNELLDKILGEREPDKDTLHPEGL